MRRRRPGGPAAHDGGPRVVVVGAGFGGLSTVARLTRAGMQVTLVDGNIYSTFQPLLYQVATAGLNPSDVSFPLRGFARKYGASFRRGEVAGIDTAGRQVMLADGSQLGYDYLILATGVSAAYYGVTGADKYSFGLYTRHDAVALRDRIMACFEQLSAAGEKAEASVNVVGGGATGVELAGTLAELRSIALASAFPDIDPGRVHIRLIEQARDLLTPFHPSLREYALRQLEGRGVQVMLGTGIREITAERVILTDGRELASELTVWAAGVAAPDGAGRWGLPQGQGGRLVTGPDLRVAGQDRIFAAGDIALIDGHPLPQLAQPALQMGRHAAEQVAALAAGQPTAAFSYHDKGIMATIGRKSAVVQLPHGIRVRGTLAWLAWLGLHLVTLLGNRNRIAALINLTYRYLTWGHGGGIILDDDPPMPQPSQRRPGRGG
jgi:NADH:ubiquinone reductase (H+-translocating)